MVRKEPMKSPASFRNSHRESAGRGTARQESLKADSFFSKDNTVAVAGASSDPSKWGRRLYEKLKAMGFKVYPINPREKYIGSDRCYPDIKSLLRKPHLVITVTKPKITEKVVQDCITADIPMLWMQPGSESAAAKDTCRKAGVSHSAGKCYITEGLRVEW